MTKTFTPNDVVRYLYSEMKKEERMEIEEAMSSDWELQEEYEILQQVKAFLGKPTHEPGNGCIHAILKYSEQSNLTVIS